MGPGKPLPYNDSFESADAYVDSLLQLLRTNELLKTLCGGVFILDFFTSEPDLYAQILPLEWREFFARHEMTDILDLLIRGGRGVFVEGSVTPSNHDQDTNVAPPASLLEYMHTLRKHLLTRTLPTGFRGNLLAKNSSQSIPRPIAVGMKTKKIHEVGHFAPFIASLAKEIGESDHEKITHLLDFGSGQSYLGRVLASEPYRQQVVAIESNSHNAERAKQFDALARLSRTRRFNGRASRAHRPEGSENNSPRKASDMPRELVKKEIKGSENVKGTEESIRGSIQHVEHCIRDGDLSDVIAQIPGSDSANIMVVSLHSCGNLVHHGLRSLVLNPQVKAVAMVGCCYNLLTERFGPAVEAITQTSDVSNARPHEDRAYDSDGFPMSERFSAEPEEGGIRLNVTARMMAVQAPQNWGKKESDDFFTRHFYRALLQKLLVDLKVVEGPDLARRGGSPRGHSGAGARIIIGSLRPRDYTNFTTYARAALAKLSQDARLGERIQSKMTLSDVDLQELEKRFTHRQKDLSVLWTLMAVSAGVIEAAIVVDRWLWLKEQKEVKEAWVESVFDYAISPRNLVVVGTKLRQSDLGASDSKDMQKRW